MPNVSVVTDSTSSLPRDLISAHRIHMQPVYITFGTQSYRDGVDIASAELYRRLRMNSYLPTTSQPTPQDFLQLYSQLLGEADGIVSIHLSSKLSATFDSALAASRLLVQKGEEPAEGDPRIRIVDSRSVSMGLGLMVLAAAREASAGKGLQEVIDSVESLIPRMNVAFTVETLEYLRRGGRIGGAAALLGTVLDIKPVLQIQDGRVEVLAKVRSRKQALARLLETMEERVGLGRPVHVAVLHADAAADAEDLARRISSLFNVVEQYVGDAGAVIGAHAGPGTVGVAFYADA